MSIDTDNSQVVMHYIQSQCNKINGTHHMSRMMLSVTWYIIWK
ncbi:hypothetical protein MtrunA17_Chr3g0142021 [Medicago truncatula]|uniref:Uncharacterized protein n=1 Tax=Medicago truncatula TaxID=3880 RepID=A0A396J702_MEDTR|nr:hypothetical protein MtrunA17_Chr3g0142021 [Medicago truncatula]